MDNYQLGNQEDFELRRAYAIGAAVCSMFDPQFESLPRVFFDAERAAIMEYDGGLVRAEAERRATVEEVDFEC
jgi:hypothetical protein